MLVCILGQVLTFVPAQRAVINRRSSLSSSSIEARRALYAHSAHSAVELSRDIRQQQKATMASTIRIGTASPATQASTAETLDQLSAIAHKAASTNIDILLLPEAYIGGYPHGTTFGSVMGDRTREGRQEYANYFAQAVDLGDTVGDGAGAALKWVRREVEGAFNEGGVARGDGTREILENIARDTGVFLVLGLIEKAGGSLYCAAVYVCPREGIIGKRRKILPVSFPFFCLILPHHLAYIFCTAVTDDFILDCHGTSSVGSRQSQHTQGCVHDHSRNTHQPCCRSLLGELYASPASELVQSKREPLADPYK